MHAGMVSNSLIHALCIPCYCRSECIYCIFLSLVCPLSLAHLWNNVDKLQFLVLDSSHDCFLLHQVYASAKKIDHLFKCVFLATALTAEMMMGKSLKSAVQLLLKLGPLIQHWIQLCFELARLDSVLCWQLRFSLFFHIKIRGWLPDLDVVC